MFSDRSVGLVVAARFISRVGGEAAFFVGIWGKAAFVFDASAGEIALLMAAVGIFTIIGTAIAGVLVDRFDPRKVIMVAELLFVPATLAMILADSMIQLTVFGAFLGITGAPVFTAIGAFAPYLTGDEDRLQSINSWIESAGLAAFVAGPAVGAIIVQFATIDWIFAVDAVTSIVAVALVAPVTLKTVAHAERTSAFGELREGLRYSYRSRQLRFYILMGSALWFAFGWFLTLEPLFYRDVLGVGVATLGWVNTILGVGLVLGSVMLPRFPAGMRTAVGLAAIILANGFAILLYVGSTEITVVIAGALVLGFAIGLFAPLHRTLIHLNSPEELVGRITGTVTVHATSAELIPLAIAPGLAGVFGVQSVLVGAGFVLGAIGLIALREGRAIDKLRVKPVPEPEGFSVADQPISPTP